MFYIVSSILYFGNMLNLFARKYYKWLPKISILFMWILFFASYDNPDSFNYNRMYLLQNSNDFGFNLLIQLATKLNFTYTQFVMIIGIIGLSLIWRTVGKYCENKSWVWLLYFLYPFMLDVVQIRNFLSMSMVIYSINFLINPSKKGVIKYCGMVTLASTFQITSLIYLPFILFKDGLNSSVKKSFLTLSILFGIFISINKTLLAAIGRIVSSFSDQSRIDYYFSVKTRFGFLIPWFVQFFLLFIIFMMYKTIKSKNAQDNNRITDLHLRFSSLIFNLNIYALLFLPFYVFDGVFTRFSRNLYILYYIFVYIFNRAAEPRSFNKVMLNISFIILISFLFFYDTIFNFGLEHIIKPVFEKNYVLDYIINLQYIK